MFAMDFRENQMKELYASIAANWIAIQDECERKIYRILIEYSERGRLLTILYIICILNAILLPKFLDKMNPLTEPRPSLYLQDGEFLIDRQKHLTLLLLCDAVIVSLVGIVCIAIDSMYIVFSQHCCALYAIVSYCNERYAIVHCTKKLLRTFMLRCSEPALLTAGGLLLMKFETYSMIMRTAMSYITVASSFC